MIIGLQFGLLGIKGQAQTTQQQSFDVPQCCELEVFIICMLQSCRRDWYPSTMYYEAI